MFPFMTEQHLQAFVALYGEGAIQALESLASKTLPPEARKRVVEALIQTHPEFSKRYKPTQDCVGLWERDGKKYLAVTEPPFPELYTAIVQDGRVLENGYYLTYTVDETRRRPKWRKRANERLEEFSKLFFGKAIAL